MLFLREILSPNPQPGLCSWTLWGAAPPGPCCSSIRGVDVASIAPLLGELQAVLKGKNRTQTYKSTHTCTHTRAYTHTHTHDAHTLTHAPIPCTLRDEHYTLTLRRISLGQIRTYFFLLSSSVPDSVELSWKVSQTLLSSYQTASCRVAWS